MIVHQLACDPLCLVPIIELLNGEGEAVVGAIVNAEDLEPWAVLIGIGGQW